PRHPPVAERLLLRRRRPGVGRRPGPPADRLAGRVRRTCPMNHVHKNAPDAFADARARLREARQAGARGLCLRAADEARAVRLCEDIGERLDWPVHTWSAASGRDGLGAPEPLAELLRGLLRDPDPGLWLLLDPPP